MLDKHSAIDFEPLVIAWTEGVEQVEGWVDAWQEDPTNQATVEAGTVAVVPNAQVAERALARATRLERVAARRITPVAANDLAAVASAMDDAGDSRVTRSGRAIRRPEQLSL